MTKQMEKSSDGQLLDTQDLAKAFECTMNVVQGHTEEIPDLLQHTGKILVKLSNRLSTTQLVLLVGALTLGAVFMVKRAEEALTDDDSDDNRDNGSGKKQKTLERGGNSSENR